MGRVQPLFIFGKGFVMTDKSINQKAVIYDYVSFPGNIHLITTDQQLLSFSDELMKQKIFGFDTETRPAFKKGVVYQVALLQLATDTDAYVIRLHGISQVVVLKNIFENPEVIKVGVAIRDDIKQLQKKFMFTPNNFIELQELAKVKKLNNLGLKGMTDEVLQATITKGPKTTNWEAAELTDRQIMYAATDAWIGLKLYQKLI